MTGAIPALSHRLRPLLAAICLGASIGVASVLTSGPALARGPDGIADVAEKVIDAVVNISTSQTIEAKGGGEGDGERNRLFAEAYGKDPDFFAFYRSMSAYENGLKSSDTRFLLRPDSDFFKFFNNSSSKPAAAEAAKP